MNDEKATIREKMVKKLSAPLFVAALLVGVGAGITGIVSAQTSTSATQIPAGGMGPRGHMGKMGPRIIGTVSGIDNSKLTIKNADGTTYTIDASNSKISKIVDLSVSDIKIGDTLGVEGTVSGTSVVARHIMDGVPPTPQAPPKSTQ